MTAFQLKLLAGLCMLLDHIGVVFLEGELAEAGFVMFGNMLWKTPLAGQALAYTALRMVGRLAFPIYAFQLAEGTRRTKNAGRYLARLALFAVISELPYDLALHGGQFTWAAQNIYWTLLLGAASIILYRREEQPAWLRWAWPVAFAAAAELMRTDYGWYGILVIFLFYLTLDDRLKRAAWLVAPLAMQVTAPLALLPINSYKGVQGRKARWAFYIYYPAHLMALYLLARLMPI